MLEVMNRYLIIFWNWSIFKSQKNKKSKLIQWICQSNNFQIINSPMLISLSYTYPKWLKNSNVPHCENELWRKFLHLTVVVVIKRSMERALYLLSTSSAKWNSFESWSKALYKIRCRLVHFSQRSPLFIS